MNETRLRASLELHEGISLKPYTDTTGHLSIGIGINLDDGITIQEAYMLLDSRISTAQKELDRYRPGWQRHNDVRQNVLIEMQFNLGAPRLGMFRKMWATLDKQDYNAAAREMLDSKWAGQVGERAVKLAVMMRTGEWPER